MFPRCSIPWQCWLGAAVEPSASWLPQPSQQLVMRHKEGLEQFLPSRCWPASVWAEQPLPQLTFWRGFLPQHLLVVALGERKPGAGQRRFWLLSARWRCGSCSDGPRKYGFLEEATIWSSRFGLPPIVSLALRDSRV